MTTGRASMLELRGITKTYGHNTVVRAVNMRLDPGQCLALIGENGAGKSTLAKMIAGITRPTAGQLFVAGEPRELRNPRDALRSSIATIPQELAYVPQMTVGENLVVGRWPHHLGFTSPRAVMKKAQAELEQVGIHLDLRRTMDDLALAERQLVEIAKVLAFNARIIILDEPTAALNEVDAGKLLELLSQLKQQGRVIIYVSHRLDESFILAERLMVLRNGEVVLDTPTENVVPDDVISAMLGKPQIASVSRSSSQAVASTRTIRESPTEAAYAAPVLRVLSWRTEGAMHLDDVSFDMYQGEIVGLFGLVGSGVELVARGLAGQDGSIRGQLEVRGHRRKPFRHPHEARRTGIGYVPAERKSDGIALNQTVKDNLLVLVLSEVASLGIVHSRAEANRAKQLAAEFFVHYSHIRQPVGDLSGGNQQKILLASRLAPVPKILVLNEPTRGVDIGARAQIHEILQHALRGASILLATSDLAEAVSLSDRLLVMRDGRIVQELVGQAKTQERALAIATRAA